MQSCKTTVVIPNYNGMKYRTSVIMGIYNCAPTLREALNSMLSQTYKCFKVILCDDGSTDDTYAIDKEYADKYENFIVIKNDCNLKIRFCCRMKS